MNILIIGNGFDLAHNLPTSYSDFMKFLNNIDDNINTTLTLNIANQFNLKLSKNSSKHNEYIQAYRPLQNDNSLNELRNLASKNIWLKHFNNTILKGPNWIDFECEISQVIKSLDSLLKWSKKSKKLGREADKENSELQDKAHLFIKNILNEKIIPIDYYIKSKEINELLVNNLNDLIRCLEIYLENVVGTINIENRLIDIEEIKSINKVISFNYTNTFEKIYDKNGQVEYDYIHGKLDISKDIKDNNMVLGIDEYLTEEESNKHLDFIEFKKYFQRIYKKTECKYKNWIEEFNKNYVSIGSTYPQKINYNQEDDYVNNIYIYGHSLDITDKDILKELITLNKTRIIIYYYDKEDYKQKIRNLISLINVNNIIKNIYGKNPKIIFKEIKLNI